jgi:hypothetical protein
MAAPALFMLAGLALAEGRDILMRAINVHGREWLPTYRSAVRTAAQITAVVVVFALVSLPAFPMSLRIPSERTVRAKADWHSLRQLLEQAPSSSALPFGSTEPLVALQYVGRSDFTIATNVGQMLPEALAALPAPRFRPSGDSVRFGGPAGSVLAPRLDALRSLFHPYGEVLIAVDSRDMNSEIIDASIRNALEDNGTELCERRCGTLRLYRLRVADPQPAPVVPPPSVPPGGSRGHD